MSAAADTLHQSKRAAPPRRKSKPGETLVYRGVRLNPPSARSTRSIARIKAAVRDAVAKHQTTLASGDQ
jgi:hypothetical protein